MDPVIVNKSLSVKALSRLPLRKFMAMTLSCGTMPKPQKG